MRQPKPFLRRDRGLWYVQIDGRQYNLGRDQDAAWAEYHRLMGRRDQLKLRDPNPTTVKEIVALFLGSLLKGNAETLRWYTYFLAPFCRTLAADLLAVDLRPWHVQKWIAGKPSWGQTSIRGAIRTVKRAMSWAVEMGYLESSPVARMSKPPAVFRQTLLSEAQIQLCLNDERIGAVRDLVFVLARTGCRVQEIRKVEARHLSANGDRWIFPVKENKTGHKTGMPRVVYLPDDVAALCRTLAGHHQDGPLFRNQDGRPWTKNAIRCVAARFKKRHGSKLPGDFCMTLFRHAWITHALQRGVPVAQVAELAGHSDLKMIQNVYSKLAQLDSHLQDAAKRAAG